MPSKVGNNKSEAMNGFFSDMGDVFQDPTVRFFGSQKPGSQSDMKMIHVHAGNMYLYTHIFGYSYFMDTPGMFMF